MAYVNVAEWSPDQVTEWLKGLDNVIVPYINSFLNNGVKGQQLLNLRADDLEHLGVYTLGHQELILEAVEHLRNFHYELDRENLQFLALRLSCAAHSLHNELSPLDGKTKVETQTMSDVANIISTIKPLVCWLDRSPFSGQTEYIDRKTEMLRLSLKMATCALRDRFAERPVTEIRETCFALAELADKIIQDISDPMLLQPASLDLATLKKRENDLGFFILPNFRNIHQIAEIKFGSPAHTSGKIEEGDEIVQVNYQTVVGWERKKVLSLFQESPPDVLLTLKKRPRHTKIYGQIYMKPYRLPSKKRSLPYNRWHDNLPSPRPELLTIPDFEMPLPRSTLGKRTLQAPPACSTDSDSCSSVSDSDGSPPQSLSTRVYPLKPRPVLQRRNTITGAIPFYRAPSISIEQFWRELKIQASYKHSSSGFIQSSDGVESNKDMLLRDKSLSYGHGLELNPRPSTVIGLAPKRNSSRIKRNDTRNDDKARDTQQSRRKTGVRFEDEVSKTDNAYTDSALHVKNEENLKFIDDNEDEVQDRSNLHHVPADENYLIDVKQTVSNFEARSVNLNDILRPIPKVRTNLPDLKFKKPPDIPPKPTNIKKPAVPPRNLDRIAQLRGRFDKSHSTPAYDTTDTDTSDSTTNFLSKKSTDEQPIDPYEYFTPRKLIAPIPPPRPTKIESENEFISNQDVQKVTHIQQATKTQLKNNSQPQENISRIKNDGKVSSNPVKAIISKGKTVKKKNSLLAKRRKVSVKDVSPGEIQGYLYQRIRNKTTQNVNWIERWFVLNGIALYGFKSKDATKAECVIFLPDFTVSVATEVKSRSNAFKVYHTGTAFYLSADNVETMSTWVDLITLATLISSESTTSTGLKSNDTSLYSETDDSDEDDTKLLTKINEKTESRKFGSLKKFAYARKQSEQESPGSTSLDRKYLRFFHSNSSTKSAKQHLPVPTAQFRSYRKVVPPALVVNPTPSDKKPDLLHNIPLMEESPPKVNKPPMKIIKPKPINYIHASNPSLCDFTDFKMPTFVPKQKNLHHRNDNLSGFITLEQFMLNRQEEERKQNAFFQHQNNDLDGDDSQDDKPEQQNTHKKLSESRSYSSCKPSESQTDKLTLCRKFSENLTPAPDHKISTDSVFEESTQDLPSVQKFRKPHPPTPKHKNKIVRQHSLNSADKKSTFNRGESPEKFWLNSLRRNDKVFFSTTTTKDKLKSVNQYTPMNYSFATGDHKLNPKLAFELNLDEKQSQSGQKTSSSSKFKNFFSSHKTTNSSDSNDKKEKTLLGSPRLHRAIFRRNHSPPTTETDWRGDFSQASSSLAHLTYPLNHTACIHTTINSETNSIQKPSSPAQLQPQTDYPGLEYPPVFEPETYSLSNPACSLLRKTNKNLNSK